MWPSSSRTLPKGSYVLTVRVKLLDGRTGVFTKKFKLKYVVTNPILKNLVLKKKLKLEV